jgi:small GTP-binding protein
MQTQDNLRELKTPPNPHINVDHIDPYKEITYDYIVKVIIIGDAGVGKSSILKMFTEYKFENNPISTMGIDFEVAFMKVTHLDENDQKTNKHDYDIGKYLTISKDATGLRKQIKHPVFKFQVWDCAGQERFHSIVKSYIRGAHIVIYAFDITDMHSFAKLEKWRQSVEDEVGTPDEGKYMSIVVGNKLDLENDRQIQQKDAREFATELNTIYAEVSAKNDENIQRLFEEITRIMYCKLLNGQLRIDHKSMIASHHLSATTTSPLKLRETDYDDDLDRCLPGRCVIL